MNDLTTLVRKAAERVEKGGESTATEAAAVIREALAQRGLAANCHVGDANMSPEQTVEWYAGQFLTIVDEGAWFAMNSWLNCVDKFAPVTS